MIGKIAKCLRIAQVSRHALDMYLSLVYSGRLSLESVVLPLVRRLEIRDVMVFVF